jgi:hypothetical protein
MKFSNLSIFYFTKYFKKYRKRQQKKKKKARHIGPAHQVLPVGVGAKFITRGGEGAPDGRSLRRFPARRPKALWIGPAHVALNRSRCLFFWSQAIYLKN